LLGDVGRSVVDLLGAELSGARTELAELGRRAVAVAALGAAALAVAFWALGAAATSAVAGLAVWLPVWGAALVLFGVLAVLALGLAMWARARMRRLDAPGAILKRRVESHLEFWRSEVLGVADVPAEPAARRDSAAPGSLGRPAVSMTPPEVRDGSEPEP
jgi:hypothetical protein